MRKITLISIIATTLLILTLLLIGGIQKMAQPPAIQAWIYPGAPACSAPTELAHGQVINILKPQYYTLSDMGTLTEITDVCNGYSIANAAAIKAHSTQQFVTIAGSIAGIEALAKSRALTLTNANALTSFLRTTQFTGIELDIEGYSSWTPQQYSMYKSVVAELGTTLHAANFKLMIDGPAIINVAYQGYYQWKYEDFNSLPADAIVSMCYDFQYDNGAGTPVAPLSNITGCCNWMLSKIADASKIIIGLNSYGYHGKIGAYTAMSNDTYEQSSQYPGFASATRDSASGEMTWTNNGIFYDYSDSTTLDKKLQTVLATGLSNMSVWHLGGSNPWFSQDTSALSPTSETTRSSDAVLPAFHAAYPNFAQWYALDKQRHYLG